MDQKLDFNQSVDHMNQVITYERLVYFGYIYEQSGMLNSRGRSSSKNLTNDSSSVEKPRLVFGKRVFKH